MRCSDKARLNIPLIAALMIYLCFAPQSQSADHTYQRALGYFNRGDYEQACPLLAELKERAPQPDSLYYYALTLQTLGRDANAIQVYEQIISSYPSSQAAPLARTALASLKTQGSHHAGSIPLSIPINNKPPQTASSRIPTTTLATIAAPNAVPGGEQTQVDFETDEDDLYIVHASANQRPVKMVFDTGAETCTFGKNHLAQLGIEIPKGRPVYHASGVGKHSPVKTWQTYIDLKVGNIVRRHFQVDVQEYLSKPLLGQTFYKDYNCYIDSRLKLIRFKEMRSARANSTYSVPFTRHGNSLVVPAEVNGKAMQMLFDTGASGICFSPDDMKVLGITVPSDAVDEVHTGVGGEAEGRGFEIESIRVGPIVKHNVHISVVPGVKSGFPLLGQSFLSDWKYTIDGIDSIINFERQ